MDGFKNAMTKEIDAQAMIDANSAAEVKELDEFKKKAADGEAYIKKSEDGIGRLEKDLNGKLSQVSQDTHKDCVRVYRNVQASLIEELDKRTETLTAKMDEIQRSQEQLTARLQAAEEQKKLLLEADERADKKADEKTDGKNREKTDGNGFMTVLQVLTLIMAAAAAAVSIISYMGIAF